jgi:hypothetical protein
MKVASIPPRQTLNDLEGPGIYKWHWVLPVARV